MHKDDYPMVHPSVFIQNPIINYMANDKHWTVSDDNKRPVNAVALLEKQQVYNIKFDGPVWPLVTLHELDADKNLECINRAYRLRARENRIIVIDVEPIATDKIKQDILNFPAHYTEISKNGGVHAVVLVPADLITDDNRYMFENLSVFKEPPPKDENGKDIRPSHFEVLFNDHFITFTKKAVLEKQAADYVNDPEAKHKLTIFLNNIVKLDIEKKKNREMLKAYKLNMIESTITDEKLNLIHEFINIEPFEHIKEKAMLKDVSDFKSDLSRYEITVANMLALGVMNIHKLSTESLSFNDIADQLNETDLVYTVYVLMQEIVEPRNKHDEERDGLPWLLYVSKKAYEYIKAKKDTKKEK